MAAVSGRRDDNRFSRVLTKHRERATDWEGKRQKVKGGVRRRRPVRRRDSGMFLKRYRLRRTDPHPASPLLTPSRKVPQQKVFPHEHIQQQDPTAACFVPPSPRSSQSHTANHPFRTRPSLQLELDLSSARPLPLLLLAPARGTRPRPHLPRVPRVVPREGWVGPGGVLD